MSAARPTIKIRLFFEPLTIEVPADEVPTENGDVLLDELLTHIEENWDEFVDPSTPIVGAIKPLGFTPEMHAELLAKIDEAEGDVDRLDRFTAHVEDITIVKKGNDA